MLEEREKYLSSINQTWASSIIQELLNTGITTLCYSPGFRSSPLILEAQLNRAMDSIPILDERSNAFFSLGVAKGKKQAVAMLCTSGTACANFHPAILEAYYSHTALFILTADRPSTLIGLGSNQSMDQKNLYGKHVHSFLHLEAVKDNLRQKDLSYLSYAIQKLAHTAISKSGPVHLNIAFEEPFLVSEKLHEQEFKKDNIEFLSKNKREPSSKDMEKIVKLIYKEKESTIILLGHYPYKNTFFEDLQKIAESLNIPIIADASSGIGFKIKGNSFALNSDLYLSTLHTLSKVKTFVRFGAAMLDKRWNDPKFFKSKKLILFDEEGEARNPALGDAIYIPGSPEAWASQLKKHFIAQKTISKNNNLLNEIKEKEIQTANRVRKLLDEEKELTEWHIARAISDFIPNNSNLFIGNSMPIRDFNSVARPRACNVDVFSNRGLSGIDGLIATAAGLAYSTKRKTFLLLGDLSAAHDVGSLSILRELNLNKDFFIIIVNNNGGEVFRKLLTKEYPESWFITPQRISFKEIAKAYGLHYEKLSTIPEIENFLSTSSHNLSTPKEKSKTARIIEVFIHREANHRIRNSI